MYYPEFGLTLPDATMVIRGEVVACFNPAHEQKLAQFCQPWYTDDTGAIYEDAFEELDINYARLMVSIPIEWIDYTILPPMNNR